MFDCFDQHKETELKSTEVEKKVDQVARPLSQATASTSKVSTSYRGKL